MNPHFDHRRTEPPRQVPLDRPMLLGCGVMLLIAGGLVYGFLWPAVQEARDAARSASSQGSLSQMALALHNFHDTHGTFPPVYIADEEGRPMHSWRVLILPFISEQDLFDRYDFDRPWDDPHNLELAREMPSIFRSGFSPDQWEQGLTPYLAIVGPDTVLGEGKKPGEEEGRTLAFLGGEARYKLAVIEYYSQPVLWTQPIDVTPQRIRSEYRQVMENRQKGINVMVIDGTVIFVPAETPVEDLEAGFHVGDGRRFVPRKKEIEEQK